MSDYYPPEIYCNHGSDAVYGENGRCVQCQRFEPPIHKHPYENLGNINSCTGCLLFALSIIVIVAVATYAFSWLIHFWR